MSESQIERWETSESQIGEETAASSAPTLRKQECAPPWVGGDAIQTNKKRNRLLFQIVRNKTQNPENSLEPNVALIPCNRIKVFLNSLSFIRGIILVYIYN